MTRGPRITFVIITTIAAQGCAATSGGEEDPHRTALSEADRAVIAAMRACDAALVTDRQRVVTKKHRYGGGEMCAAPATDLEKLTLASYRPGIGTLVAFVDVLNAEDGYRDNRFESGRNCIYVKGDGDRPPESVEDLDAFVIHLPEDAECYGTAAGGRDLKFAASDSMAAGDVPPVVRLDMNYGKQNLITGRRIVVSFKCLPHHWCQVSRKGASPPLNKNADARRVVAGWFDEQYLGVKVGNDLRPSEVYASIYPAPGLDTLVRDIAHYRTWVNVAEIRFRDEEDVDDDEARMLLARYAHKWGFDTLATRIGMKDAVAVQMMRYKPGNDTLIARYVVNGVTGKPRKVYRVGDDESQHMLFMPIRFAATRWAWDPDDENAWVRCPAGCCSITEEEFRPGTE
jgi:hypothetical protein